MSVAACATLATVPVTLVMRPACPLSAPLDCTAATNDDLATSEMTLLLVLGYAAMGAACVAVPRPL